VVAHSVGDLDESTDVGTDDQARESSLGRTVLEPSLVARIERIGHDVLELSVDLLAGPCQPLRVLGHLKSGDSDTTAVGGLCTHTSVHVEDERHERGLGDVLPGAYQIQPSPPCLRVDSNTSIASCVQPMLEPSATNLTPAATSAFASSPETSF
jgi:hypothetical protein